MDEPGILHHKTRKAEDRPGAFNPRNSIYYLAKKQVKNDDEKKNLFDTPTTHAGTQAPGTPIAQAIFSDTVKDNKVIQADESKHNENEDGGVIEYRQGTLTSESKEGDTDIIKEKQQAAKKKKAEEEEEKKMLYAKYERV